MAARKRARKRMAKKGPAVSQAVLNRTKAAVKEAQTAKKQIDLHLKSLQKYLRRLMTHIHK